MKIELQVGDIVEVYRHCEISKSVVGIVTRSPREAIVPAIHITPVVPDTLAIARVEVSDVV